MGRGPITVANFLCSNLQELVIKYFLYWIHAQLELTFDKTKEIWYNCIGSESMSPSELFISKTKQTGLYNIQAIDNIPSIMQRGLLSNERSRKIKHTSIAMEEVQQRRDIIYVPNGLGLHQYANVYFDPRNPMLFARRDENENICILKFDSCILDFEGVVVSDRNASSDYAGFIRQR